MSFKAASLRACPTHQRVLPTPSTRQDIPVKTPTVSFCSTALHRVANRLVYAHDAVTKLLAAGKLDRSPLTGFVAAVSVGIVEGTPLLDLEYVEDSACDTDMNVVMTGAGHFIEVQGTAEGAAFSRVEMNHLLDLADAGIRQLIVAQKTALGLA